MVPFMTRQGIFILALFLFICLLPSVNAQEESWSLEIKTWGVPGSDQFSATLNSTGFIQVEKKSLPITKNGLTTVERQIRVKPSELTNIRIRAEQAIKALDFKTSQSRVADGTNISIKLTVGTIQIGTQILGLTMIKDSGPQIEALINGVNDLLPGRLKVY
jgi:hypothetical protein